MPIINKKRLPNNLRKCRLVRGFKQKDVAKILGFGSTSTISKWENGYCLPNTLNTFRLAILYRCMIDALFFDLKIELQEGILKSEENFLKAKVKSEK